MVYMHHRAGETASRVKLESGRMLARAVPPNTVAPRNRLIGSPRLSREGARPPRIIVRRAATDKMPASNKAAEFQWPVDRSIRMNDLEVQVSLQRPVV